MIRRRKAVLTYYTYWPFRTVQLRRYCLKYNIGDPEKIWQQKMEEFPGEVVVVGQLVMWAL
jgi:hypothetical protein